MAEISSKVLGQINLMQSMTALLPTVEDKMDFVCSALSELPGVRIVSYRMASGSEAPQKKNTEQLIIQYNKHHFLDILFTLHNADEFLPYWPFLENFGSMLGVILEERRQKEENERLNRELEERVNNRTQQLHEREEDLLITLNSIGDGVITTDLEGNITRMNPVSEKLTGWALSEAITRPLENVFHIISSDDNTAIPSPVEKVLKSGRVVGLANHTTLIARDGTHFHIADSAAPIRDSHGELRGVVLVFQDVTEEYKLQEELHQSRKMEAIGKLAGGIAHDFNNVLSGIIGAADLLLNTAELDEFAKKYLGVIITAAENASSLTAKLLAFGRKNQAKKTPLNMHTLIEDTETILGRSLDKKIVIKKQLNAKAATILGDSSLLQNSIINMAINASHAMPDGGTFSIITENKAPNKVDSNDEYLHLNLSDTGSGISKENLDKIFDPFFTTKEKGKGTGLGLSAVYGTINEHKGKIKVESYLGKGTTFHIYLPLTKEEHIEQPKKQELISGQATILAVDDEDSVRLILQAILSSLHYTIILAKDGKEAIDIYKKRGKDIDLVVLDMIMPKMNGKETYTKLKEMNPDIKVIVCSGYSNEGEIAAMRKMGIDGYIHKPFTTEKLSSTIANLLQ